MERINALLRRHSRFEPVRAAYVDGELHAAERARFEAHLSGCRRCNSAIEDERAIRLMLSTNLPEVPAPRSFRLTEAMVARPARGSTRTQAGGSMQPHVRSQVMVMARVSQATAALAAFALVAVFAFDLTSSSNGDPSRSSSIADSAFDAPGSAELTGGSADDLDDGGKIDDGGKPRSEDSTNPAATLPPPDDGVTGSGVEPTQAPDPGEQRNDPGRPGDSVPAQGEDLPYDTDDAAAEFAPTSTLADDSGVNNLRVIQFGLGAVLLSALAAMFIARRQVGRNPS